MRRSTDSGRVSHNFPRTNSAAATETRGGVAGSVTHNFCRTETCVLSETDRDQSMRMSPPRSPLSLSRSPVRSSVRLSAGNRYGQLKTIIAAREPTDRPSEGASDRPSSVACGAAAVIAASEPREGEGPATGVVMFLGQQHRGARCLVRLLFVSVRPSVRWTI